jgi:hypothetical protein
VVEALSGDEGGDSLHSTLIQSVRDWISRIIWSMVLEKRVLYVEAFELWEVLAWECQGIERQEKKGEKRKRTYSQ